MGHRTNNCQGRDVMERMNFLYQAGNLVADTSTVLSCYYGHLCRSVAKKAVLRMEPNIKRTICKSCGNIMRPGISADISIDAVNRSLCNIECLKCGVAKKFIINAKYKLWLDNPDAVKETLNFNQVPNQDASQNLNTNTKSK